MSDDTFIKEVKDKGKFIYIAKNIDMINILFLSEGDEELYFISTSTDLYVERVEDVFLPFKYEKIIDIKIVGHRNDDFGFLKFYGVVELQNSETKSFVIRNKKLEFISNDELKPFEKYSNFIEIGEFQTKRQFRYTSFDVPYAYIIGKWNKDETNNTLLKYNIQSDTIEEELFLTSEVGDIDLETLLLTRELVVVCGCFVVKEEGKNSNRLPYINSFFK